MKTKAQILNDELSDVLIELIDENEPLRKWIYDAMEEYATQSLSDDEIEVEAQNRFPLRNDDALVNTVAQHWIDGVKRGRNCLPPLKIEWREAEDTDGIYINAKTNGVYIGYIKYEIKAMMLLKAETVSALADYIEG